MDTIEPPEFGSDAADRSHIKTYGARERIDQSTLSPTGQFPDQIDKSISAKIPR